MLSFSEKIIGARAILGWSQQELAENANLGLTTIQSIEAGKGTTDKTFAKISRALSRGGIEITEDGIRKPDTTITRLEGPGWFAELLDDVLYTLRDHKDKEVLIFGGNNRVSPPPVVEGFRRLKNEGIRIREIVEEGNDYLMGDEKDYRWIPSQYFKNHVTITYANKVGNDFHTHGVLFTNAEWAATERNRFNLIWSLLPELPITSTADVRY